MAGISEGGSEMMKEMLLQVTAAEVPVSDLTILIIIILVLLLLTAVTSGAETAFFSLRSKDVNYLKTREDSAARQAVRLLGQPKMLLATMLVTNTAFNIAIIITTNMLLNGMLGNMGVAGTGVTPLLVKIVVIAFLLVLFGSILPKVYATQNNTRMVLFSAPMLTAMLYIFRPVSRMLVSSSSFFEGRLNARPGESISTEAFEHAIEATVGHTATREEVNIFRGIMKFGSITVKQIMRTRMDVAGLSYELSFPQVQQYAIRSGYSRMPVYKENLDTVAGMIHTKDFLPHAEDDGFDWHSLIRPAHFVHEGKRIEDLLHEFQKNRIHLAIVVDEFGGTSGIVTLEDIMEEIIGEIRDEFDEDDPNYRKLDELNYIFDGKTLINDMCRIIGVASDSFAGIRGESDSVAGLILEISGRFPAVNETVSWQQYEFTALEIDRMRIIRVKLTIHAPDDGHE